MEPSEQSRKRTASKGWLTRSRENLNTLMTTPEDTTLLNLSAAIDDFEKRLLKFDECQSDYELTIEDEDSLMGDIQKSGEFRDLAMVSLIKAKEMYNKMNISHDHNGSDNISHSSAQVDVRLPKLNLPKFSGDVLQWQSFWDQFVASVDSTDLPGVSKFTYLLSLLEGEPKLAIKGLSLTSSHYDIACKILKDRFGRREAIIFNHIQKLLHLVIPSKCTVSALWKLNDELKAHTRSLEALGIDGKQYGVILTPLILSRLPQDLRLEWSRDGEGHESDLDFLLTFLEKEIQRRERSHVFQDTASNNISSRTPDERKVKTPTAAALQAATSTSNCNARPNCAVCQKSHTTERCFQLRGSVEHRRERLRTAGLCFRCLQSGHISRGCSATCSNCGGRHHELLCFSGSSSASTTVGNCQSGNQSDSRDGRAGRGNVSADAGAAAPVSSVNLSRTKIGNKISRPNVTLQFARVRVFGSQGTTEVTAMFDTGADRSYVTNDLVKKVQPRWVDREPIAFAAFGASSAGKSTLRDVFSVSVGDVKQVKHDITAAAVDVICVPLSRPAVPSEILDSFGNVTFADQYEFGSMVKVDLLFGLDVYWRFVLQSVIPSEPPGIVAQETLFGWMVSGCIPGEDGVSLQSHQLLCAGVSDDLIKSFWNLESIGIVEDETPSVDRVLKEFEKTLSCVEGRYEVALPWRPGASSRLQNNERLAAARLRQLDRRLFQDPPLRSRYDAVIQEMWESGVVEEVPANERSVTESPVFYMPHRPVVRDSVSTKVRPVFDASAKGYNGVSLNDCMEVGPCLLGDLTAILLRFRRWKIAITADVEKAFLQISVRAEDRDVHRFLWNQGGEVRHMRFRRVPFGNCSSPFLLNATVQHHLSTVPPSTAVQELQDNLYVDDWLSGTDVIADACSLAQDASSVMGTAMLPLAKWVSNSPEVAEVLHREFQDKCVDAEAVKVLGIKWMAVCDSFSFNVVAVPEGACITKRLVLGCFSRLFDPLGFTAPFVMAVKSLFQELWSLGLQWDDALPVEYRVRFQQWVKGLDVLTTWFIPRCYTASGWSSVQGAHLHGFGDASPKGYGACIYLAAQMEDGTVSTSLVMAKGKVAPLKKISLPRLELLACLLCARLLTFVREALRLPADVLVHCWTDSMIALSWIKSSPERWKTFVANRVSQIQALVSSDRWAHCPGTENPADLLTRGIPAQELVHSQLWLHGPAFIRDSFDYDNEDTGDDSVSNLSSVALEEAASPVLVSSVVPIAMFDVDRWGSLTKAIRVVAWVQRFLCNVRKKTDVRLFGEISYEEMKDAKLLLLQQVQSREFPEEVRALREGRPISKSSSLYKLTPYLADDNLLRVEGRLHQSDLTFDEKHPILLPRCHLAVLLVRFQHSLMKHAGVSTMMNALRKCYWILGLRRIAKRVKKMCVSCQRQDVPACSQRMAPLPAERVTPAVPFAVTGLDHAGPLYCCDIPRKKFWILLFTCAVTRAVHLELVDSLSSPETVLALRRLAARRGLPQQLFSDNAKGFTASPTELRKQFGPVAPKWTFIAPLSPWWGGWWERLIRSVKSSLKKTVGSNCLTRSELETTIQEIEACVNSRPLTFQSDELGEDGPLTPSHFLLGHGSGFVQANPAGNPVDTGQQLGSRYEIRKSLLDKFWSVWTAEYIRGLPPWKGASPRCNLREGSVVLLQDQRCPRLKWPLGVVARLIPGRDGVVRTVEVKTATGTFVRSVQRVHDLELHGYDDVSDPLVPDSKIRASDEPVVSEIPVPYTTRRGRVIKPVVRLDM